MAVEADFGSLDGLHTFPRLLLNHARTRPDAPAMREKYLGIWQTWSWADVAGASGRWPAALPNSVSSAATTSPSLATTARICT